MRLVQVSSQIARLVLIAFMLGGCSEDAPVASDQTKAEVTATIGPSGGAVTTSDFSLVVPAGAFATSATITLTPLSSTHPFGSSGVSRLFGVQGIPATFSIPLTLTITPTSPGTGPHFIAAGNEVPFPAADSLFMVFSFINAKDSAGRMMCTIPPRGNSGSPKSHPLARAGCTPLQDEIDIFIAIAGYDTTEFYNFVLYAPTFVTEEVKIGTLAALNYARAHILNMGLPFPQISPVRPIESMVYRFNNQPKTAAVYLTRNARYKLDSDQHGLPLVGLNVEFMVPAEKERIIAQCGREAFMFVPEEIYGIDGFNQYVAPDRYWLHCAVGSWFEEKVTQDPNHVPSELAGNELQALQGISAGAGQSFASSRKHGLGMAPLIKYLTASYREELIWRIYEGLKGGSEPVDALLNGMADPPSEWYVAFLKQYLTGGIYGIPAEKFLNGVQATASIKTEKDSLFLYPVSYADLSARLFLVDLAYPDIDANARLRITLNLPAALENNAFVLLFAAENGKLAYWESGTDVIVANVRDLTAAGRKVLVAVINSSCEKPYDVPLTAELRMRIEKPGAAPFKTAAVECLFWAPVVTSYGTELPSGAHSYNGRLRPGIFMGNTFTSSWNEADRRGQLVITSNVTAGTPTVSYFRVEESYVVASDTMHWTVVSKPGISFYGQIASTHGYWFDNRGSSNADFVETVTLVSTSPSGSWWRTKQAEWVDESRLVVTLETNW